MQKRSEKLTPRENKRLSYSKDRRNAYGESDKGSRKIIPLRKAQSWRKLRQGQRQALVVSWRAGVDPIDMGLLSQEAYDIANRGRYRKHSDMALGQFIRHQERRRRHRTGRKAKLRQAMQNAGQDDA